MPSTTLGDRLKEARKRAQLTQRDLARASGVSLSLICKLEQNEHTGTRLETAHRLAAALNITTVKLLEAEPDDGTPAPVDPADQWAPVRAALADTNAQPSEVPTLTGVRGMVEAAVTLYPAGQFSDLAAILPRLIRDTRALADDAPAGRSSYARLLQLAGSMFVMYRQFDAADEALTQALAAADTPHQAASVANVQCWLLMRRGRLAESQRLAERWADETEPRMSQASALELAAWGRMLLRTAAAAARDNRSGDAEDALRLARSAAVAIRPGAIRDPVMRTFSAATVQRKRAEAASVTDKPDRVLELAAKIPPVHSNDHRRHLLDVAHAQVVTRRHAEAFETLWEVWEAAPEWLPQQRYAQDILGKVVHRRRTLTPQMRQLADALTLPL